MRRERVWSHVSRKLVVLLLAVAVLPAGTLVWLGLQLFAQDRALLASVVAERRRTEAQSLINTLDQAVVGAERLLTEGDIPAGMVRLTFARDRATAFPADRMLWQPVSEVDRVGAVPSFEDAERLECAGTIDRALASFEIVAAPNWALSPDGMKIAIGVPVEGSTTRSRLITVDVDGSDWREIHTFDSAHSTDTLRWTPDGQWLLFIAQPVGAPTWRLMRIPAAGGTAEFDGLDSAAFVSNLTLPKIVTRDIANFQVSPDGSRVVFGSDTIPMHELWSLDHLLSALTMR